MGAIERGDGEAIAARFEGLPTASIFDVMDHRGLAERCCLSLAIRPLIPGRRLAGPAFTVRLGRDPRSREEWNPPGLAELDDLFSPIGRGDVVVVDGAGDRACGHWGEMLSIMARRSGARGVVVDGGTRDSEGIKSLENWAAFARYTTPIESLARMRIHEIQAPLSLEGALGSPVNVQPGDWIVADDDAVLAIPIEHATEVLAAAEAIEELEEGARRDLVAGADINMVFARYGRA